VTADSSQFLWDQAADEVRTMIADELLVPGDLVPSVRELAAQTGLERTSCYEGLRLLAREGVLTRGGTPAGRLRVAGGGDARVAAARAAWEQSLLTDAERRVVDLMGGAYTLLRDEVVGHGPTREADLAELITPIHIVQRAVQAQAAGRADPLHNRLLGEVILKKEAER
jgi:DNA-binding transcriptional MocR family regulator